MMEFSLQESLYIDAAEKFLGIKLKDEQSQAIVHFSRGNDVFIVLPTGFGKSACYQCLPALWPNSVIIVISPLIALIKDQVQALKQKTIMVGCFTGEEDDEKNIQDLQKGKFQLIYFTPESIMLKKKFRKTIMSDFYKHRIRGLIIDEVHTIKKWGLDFRETLLRLGEVRSLVPQGTPLMALTATATKSLRYELENILGMKAPISIIQPPCKVNIMYRLEKYESISKNFSTLLHQLQTQRKTFPKTLIYCRRIEECADIYIYFKEALKVEFTEPIGAPDLSQFRLVEMFTSVTEKIVKDKIIMSFSKKDSSLRIVCATVAFGMGIDCPDVRDVIHINPPDDIESYIQETGRAGRDGLQATATLLLKSCVPSYIDKNMKKYINNKEECRRHLLFSNMEGYNEQIHSVSPHICCDVCARIKL